MSNATIRVPLDASTARALSGPAGAARASLARVARAARVAPARVSPAPGKSVMAGAPEELPDRQNVAPGPTGRAGDSRADGAPAPGSPGSSRPRPAPPQAPRLAGRQPASSSPGAAGATFPGVPPPESAPTTGEPLARPGDTAVPSADDVPATIAAAPEPRPEEVPYSMPSPAWTEDLTAGQVPYPSTGTTIHIGVLYSAAPLDRALNTLTRTS